MTYEQYLDRALSETPGIEASTGRFSRPDHDVHQEGNVTVFENVQETRAVLARWEDHVMKFLQSELVTRAHIDDQRRLRLTGVYPADRLGDALDAYADGYVRCPECGLPDTRLETDDGTSIRRCEACDAHSATGP